MDCIPVVIVVDDPELGANNRFAFAGEVVVVLSKYKFKPDE